MNRPARAAGGRCGACPALGGWPRSAKGRAFVRTCSLLMRLLGCGKLVLMVLLNTFCMSAAGEVLVVGAVLFCVLF